MKQWDVVDYTFPDPVGLHPAVVFSPDSAMSNPDITWINLLIITTVRPGYQAGRFDVMLNGADGLEHLSRVRVSPIWQADKALLGRRRGTLSVTRQKVLANKIRQVYRLD
jgi:hypothetical protein